LQQTGAASETGVRERDRVNSLVVAQGGIDDGIETGEVHRLSALGSWQSLDHLPEDRAKA
jgi:hypothetical protein